MRQAAQKAGDGVGKFKTVLDSNWVIRVYRKKHQLTGSTAQMTRTESGGPLRGPPARGGIMVARSSIEVR